MGDHAKDCPKSHGESLCFCTSYDCDRCGDTSESGEVFVYEGVTITAKLPNGTVRARGMQLCPTCDKELEENGLRKELSNG